MDKRGFASRHRKMAVRLLRVVNRLNPKNSIVLHHNPLRCGTALLSKVKIRVSGTDNEIIIEDFAKLTDCKIFISGSHNRITIGAACSLRGLTLSTEDDGNEIRIGDGTTVHGQTHLAAMESTRITVGSDCMFSSEIDIRTGDSHSIVNGDGVRINPSKDVVIGDHVWIGTKVICLKGTQIGDNCIVGAGSILTGDHSASNCVLGGVPAAVLKTGVTWQGARI